MYVQLPEGITPLKLWKSCSPQLPQLVTSRFLQVPIYANSTRIRQKCKHFSIKIYPFLYTYLDVGFTRHLFIFLLMFLELPGMGFPHLFLFHKISKLVDAFNPSEKLVNWDMIIPNIWKNKKCSKPPTRKKKPWESLRAFSVSLAHPRVWMWLGKVFQERRLVIENLAGCGLPLASRASELQVDLEPMKKQNHFLVHWFKMYTCNLFSTSADKKKDKVRLPKAPVVPAALHKGLCHEPAFCTAGRFCGDLGVIFLEVSHGLTLKSSKVRRF